MEVEVADSIPSVAAAKLRRGDSDKDRLRVKKKTLQAVLDQCQRALESLGTTADGADDDGDDEEEDRDGGGDAVGEGSGSTTTTTSPRADCEADELCNLLKSRVECPDFLEKLESAQASVPQNIAEEGNSWDLVSEKDLWEYEDDNLGEDEYVLVKQEDIVEGIACFMAAYLLSLKETKELTPTQLQEALSKTFSVKKKKGKLRKAWDGSKVIYNVASWGATAIGIYQNPVIVRAATKAFWTSCQVISKLL
ncbi:PREDICTED: uncharacterized protein LOC101315240 isoform X1 [Fragaria vesca subsp. vesca]|uniref:uncharacterized protein LOC101315240 isoform X1 n=1 Tax=Fragaria vesca subsp. vesca TaxID=101020 RepID=UPI0002C2E1F9|nr:PREDICTED: uncharacterized protein LOC101315240 isoform X1 [Fragaria vesca subsp. vesca]